MCSVLTSESTLSVNGSDKSLWSLLSEPHEGIGGKQNASLLAVFSQLLLTTLLAAFGKVSLSMKLRHLGGQI